jgi:putative protease
MIEHIPDVISAGIRALKIEGRMKSVYYVGITTRAYRQALDGYYANPDSRETNPAWLDELRKTGNREFTTGFYLGEMQAGLTPAGGAEHKRSHSFVGLAIEHEGDGTKIEVRGRIQKGDVLECVQSDGNDFTYTVESLIDEKGSAIDVAQPNQIATIPNLDALPYSLLRKPEIAR